MAQDPAVPRRTRRAASRSAGPPTPSGSAGQPTSDDRGSPDSGSPDTAAASNTHQVARRRPRPPRVSTGNPAAAPPAPPVAVDQPPGRPAPARTRGGFDNRGRSDSDRSLRALVTTRPTQLSPSAAMRARDVAAPSAADLAEAAADLVIVRRNYVPPAPLPPARKRVAGAMPSARSTDRDTPNPHGRQRRSRSASPSGKQGGGPAQDGNTGTTGSAS